MDITNICTQLEQVGYEQVRSSIPFAFEFRRKDGITEQRHQRLWVSGDGIVFLPYWKWMAYYANAE